MTTQIRLHTADGRPYNVSMDVERVNVQTVGETLPRSIVGGITFRVDVPSFSDLARIVAVLSPGAVATLRDALMADAAAVGEALR